MKSLKMMALNSGMDGMGGDEDDMKWQTESDLRTVIDAEKIKRDPARMEAVKLLAKEKKREYDDVAGTAPAAAKPMPIKGKMSKPAEMDEMDGDNFDDMGA